MFPGWENIIKKLRVSRPRPEITDLHTMRQVPERNPTAPTEKHPEPGAGLAHAPPQPTGSPVAKGAPGVQRLAAHPDRVLRCPVCGLDMVLRYFGNVEVDQCPKCLGVFLDRGELRALAGEAAGSFQRTESEEALIYTPHGLTDHVCDISTEKPGHS